MPIRAQQQRPLLRGFTFTENGTALANTVITLYNQTNNGSITRRTNSNGKVIVDLSNFHANDSTVSYSNGDTIKVVVGGI